MEDEYVINRTRITAYFLYRIRKVMKLSIRKAVDLYGTTYTYYYQVEHFDSQLTLLKLFYVLDMFQINLADFGKVVEIVEKALQSSDKMNETTQIDEECYVPMHTSVLDVQDVSDMDEYLGFKAVAEVDELIYNMIKDSETYKALKK
ncbi:hypothetical protein LH678_19235 [Acinetobacter baumannii]|uniref:hypothetical protein n=1 Tax=Acinetobacter baumannii TaxID=470 RepID=UPI001F48ABC9|nr:hypothetical protein [Acinetobacter baumannii]MCF1334407.1 hypothetical protein [Acinetobacter baumannii]